MKKKFIEYISKYQSFTKAEMEAVGCLDIYKFYPKNSLILKENQLSSNGYFVIQGSIRCYYIIEGEEKTTAFYIEGESLSPVCSINAKPSPYFISAVDDSYLVEVNIETKQRMFQKFPKFESLCRMMTEDQLLSNQSFLDEFKTQSPEKRYLFLLENRSDLLKRLPQHQIASYLGITPQSLSRMRKRISSRRFNFNQKSQYAF